MPLIGDGDPERLPEKARQIFDKDPRKINMTRLWVNAGTMFRPFVMVVDAIMNRQKLDPAARELVIMMVTRLDGGRYPWAQHIPAALKAGVRPEQLTAIERLDFESQFDGRERALLQYVREVRSDARAHEETVEAAKVFFSQQELVEIIMTAGFYMTMSRLTETARTEIDAPEGVAIPAFQPVKE